MGGQIEQSGDPDVGTGGAARTRSDPDGFHAQALGGRQIGARVFDQDALPRCEAFALQQAKKGAGMRLGQVIELLDAVDLGKAARDAQSGQHLLDVRRGGIGEDDLAPRETLEQGGEAGFGDQVRA